MRQVPEIRPKYLVVGNGRLAKHITHYLGLLNLPFSRYTRQSLPSFTTLIADCSHVLVLISDREIVSFIEQHKNLSSSSVLWIHCSGSLTTELAVGAHPLSSFSDQLFADEFYRHIPFIIEKGRKKFAEILPGFPNPFVPIDPMAKAKYHAMCVLAGNFSTILWMEFEKYLVEDLQVSKEFMFPYLQSVAMNLENALDPLTGPLKRNDNETIQRNMKALNDEALNALYTAFVTFYTHKHRHEKHS